MSWRRTSTFVERDLLQKPGIDVGDRDASGRADTLRRATSRSIRSPPPTSRQCHPGATAAIREMALRGRIEQGGQGGEAGRGVSRPDPS